MQRLGIMQWRRTGLVGRLSLTSITLVIILAFSGFVVVLVALPDTNAHRAYVAATVLGLISDIQSFADANDGLYPRSWQDLIDSPQSEMAQIPLDPFGRPLIYEALERDIYRFRIYSLGRDGKIGGRWLNEDTVMWVGPSDIDRTSEL